MHTLSGIDARRLVLRAQLLTAARPGDVHAVLERLVVVQNDPTRAVAPSADLVMWSRLGSAYDVSELRDAVESQQVIDHQGLLRPAGDMRLLRAEMALWPGEGDRKPWQEELVAWVGANDGARREVLELLRQEGPLPASAIPDTCELPWRSSGWNDGRSIRRLLELMSARGEVATAGTRGREKLWDLAERIYPDDPLPDPVEARRVTAERRLTSLGIARARVAIKPGEPFDVGAEVGEPAVVEGVKGQWRVDPALLDARFEGRTALLSPFDRTVADRRRTEELFGFDYLLEMFKPADQRRFGYYALPILSGDRLVGKLDATAARDEGVLRVHAVHEDEPFDASTRAAVHAEVEDLGAWLGLEVEHD